MPGQFLSNAQRRHYGQFRGEPTTDQLARYFHLDDADRSHIRRIRGHRNRLGFALQLCTVRFLGTLLPNPVKTPPSVIDHVAHQLKVRNVRGLAQYANESTRWRHAERIKAVYGYREFTDSTEGFRLTRRLYTRAWLSDERPSVLFDFATSQLVDRKVLLPGATVLERFVAKVRDRATRRFWRRLAALPSRAQIDTLEALLQTCEGERRSSFDQLRRSPVRINGPALVGALDRLEAIRALGVASLDVSGVSPSRLKSLTHQAFKANAQTVSRMTRNRRAATLLAFGIAGETIALDEALDVLDALITDIVNKAKHRGQKKRLATLRDLDVAAIWGSRTIRAKSASFKFNELERARNFSFFRPMSYVGSPIWPVLPYSDGNKFVLWNAVTRFTPSFVGISALKEATNTLVGATGEIRTDEKVAFFARLHCVEFKTNYSIG